MSGKKSRDKGHRYERQIVNEMKALGYPNATTTRLASPALDAQKVDITNVGDMHIQCKNVQRTVNYAQIMEDMPKDGKMNVVFHSKGSYSSKREFVILEKKDFYKLLNPEAVDLSDLKKSLTDLLAVLDGVDPKEEDV